MQQESEITPQHHFTLGLRELFEHRELLYFFTLRDIKVKYKQTVLGVLWSVLQPLLLALLFTVFLGKPVASYIALPMPYALFAFSGLVIWGIFSSGLNNAGNSMVTNANIIRKIYFPRLIIPISAVLVSVFDFLMAFVVFLAFCVFQGFPIQMSAIVYFPLALIITCITTFGAGTWLAALNVKYRDFRYIIPFMIQFLLFVSPVIYPLGINSNYWLSLLVKINPMSAALELFRAPLGSHAVDWTTVGISSTMGLLLLIVGLYYFRKTEAYFADLA